MIGAFIHLHSDFLIKVLAYLLGGSMKQRREDNPETLIYIEQMLGELGKLAKKTDNPLLAYMIQMASEEAKDLIEGRRNH